MKIYTKTGDAGTTSLVHMKNVAKSDDRVEVMGTIDELTSHIGLIKTKIQDEQILSFLEEIQHTLMTVMAGIADSYNMKYKLKDGDVEKLEKEIDRLEALFDRPKQFILPGENPVSAQIDVTRTVARRAERCLSQVSIKFGCDIGAKRYMNRLADYLYVLARYYDAKMAESTVVTKQEQNAVDCNDDVRTIKENNVMKANQTEETLIQQVLMRMGQGKMTLETSKKLIEKIEEEAERRGKKAVIAVCSPDGNPIAVHVMDGAFLVSFDVAVRKAYTSVAVKMSTMELSKLAQPGQTFYGLDKLEGGKIVIFGGGVPLVYNGTIIGGLGVSGGTGEEDHSLAEYGQSVLEDILKV
ncbi:MAG: cob(I)yrinic acid a,c-diamide adenosyltransferase [Oliverpabstia sp.]